MSLGSQTPQLSSTEAAVSPARYLTYAQVMMYAAVIGSAGGLVATAYYYVLEAFLHFTWHSVPDVVIPMFPSGFSAANYVWIATTIGGFLVGLTLHEASRRSLDGGR